MELRKLIHNTIYVAWLTTELSLFALLVYLVAVIF